MTIIHNPPGYPWPPAHPVNPFSVPSRTVVGTCGLCGGKVTKPISYGLGADHGPKCNACGAKPVDQAHGPKIDMQRPKHRVTITFEAESAGRPGEDEEVFNDVKDALGYLTTQLNFDILRTQGAGRVAGLDVIIKTEIVE